MDKRAHVLKLYNEGVKLAEITKRTGLGQGSIYWILQQAGVQPSRIGKPKVTSGEQILSDLVQQLLDRIARLEQENAELRAQIGHSTR